MIRIGNPHYLAWTSGRCRRAEFPGIGGFSPTNLWLMAQFYSEYHTVEILHPLVGEISWTKHIVILNKCNRSSTCSAGHVEAR
jgi:predicted nuclease of restriction endonuclease-like (RecB) superfamily